MIRENFRAILLFATGILMLSLLACDPSIKLEKQEKEQINEYLSQNSTLHFVKQPSGLYYLEVVAGTGTSPVRTDSAYVKYTGMLLDGTVFNTTSTSGKVYGFIVGQNITGFDEGVTKMKPGGKSTLLIPSKLGYGSGGSYSIPGFTPLLFDLELVKVVPYAGD